MRMASVPIRIMPLRSLREAQSLAQKQSTKTVAQAADETPSSERAGLGSLVRTLRRNADLTLEQLAAASGVSRAMLSSVERGDKSPTLPILGKIASGLGVTISELMGEQTPWVVASVTARRNRLVYRDDRTGIERHLLSPTHLDTGMEVVEHVLPAGQVFDGFPHVGVRTSKCVVAIEGQLTLELGNVVYALEVGDSLTFEVSGEYRFRNNSSRLCRYYLFMTHVRLPVQ